MRGGGGDDDGLGKEEDGGGKEKRFGIPEMIGEEEEGLRSPT